MTPPNPMPGDLRVVQSDRDCAAELKLVGRAQFREAAAVSIRSGNRDNFPEVQIIARYRTTIEAAARESAAKVVENNRHMFRNGDSQILATAIRESSQ